METEQKAFETDWTAANCGHDAEIAGLRAALAQILAEFADSLNKNKPVGYTAGSMQRALRAIMVAEAALKTGAM